MKRWIIGGALAICAAIPATVGLVGNASFGQSVPVRVPASAILLDDRGGEITSGRTVELADDHHGTTTTATRATTGTTRTVRPSTSRSSEPGDDRHTTGDDRTSVEATHGGRESETAGHRATEPGDDRGGAAGSAPSAGSASSTEAAHSGGSGSTSSVGSASGRPAKTGDGASGSGSGDNGGRAVQGGGHGGKDDGAGHQ